jgi:hypothetical protein
MRSESLRHVAGRVLATLAITAFLLAAGGGAISAAADGSPGPAPHQGGNGGGVSAAADGSPVPAPHQ